MAFDIVPDTIQQLVEEKFADLHVRLDKAKSVEECAHLIADVEQYIHGMLDFYAYATPTAMPPHAQAEGQVDEDVLIQNILDTALHAVHKLAEELHHGA